MKTEKQLDEILDKVSYDGTKFPERCYEDGIHDVLMWILNETNDKEFEKTLKKE